MNNNLTHVLIILDRSGSMQTIEKATVDGVNEFVNGQKADAGRTNLTLTLFDKVQVEDIVFDGDVQKYIPLNNKTFTPRGMTPLYDAIGLSINRLGRRLALTNGDRRPGKVVIVIVTDGEENASREFTQQEVSDMVKHQTEVYNWNFIYLGANHDAVLTAKKLGIAAEMSAGYDSTAQSVSDMWKFSSSNISSLKSSGLRASLSYSGVQRSVMQPSPSPTTTTGDQSVVQPPVVTQTGNV